MKIRYLLKKAKEFLRPESILDLHGVKVEEGGDYLIFVNVRTMNKNMSVSMVQKLWDNHKIKALCVRHLGDPPTIYKLDVPVQPPLVNDDSLINKIK